MSIWISVLLLVLGAVLIIKGGDFFVDAASWMAEVSGIPKLIVGATVVSLATTLPELLVSVMAAVQGKVDMSIGNAVGSVTANVGLIMAISLIAMPGLIQRRDYLPKSALLIAAAAAITVAGLLGRVELGVSVVLLGVFALFIVENVSSARRAMALGQGGEEDVPRDGKTVALNLLKFVLGTAGIIIGADLLVDSGSDIARFVGISERVIGVTVIAVGTSLPELITTVTAIAKKQSALSVGNILGANIIDLTLIMPLSSLVSGKPLPVSPASRMLDLPVCLLVCLLGTVPALVRKKFTRGQGILILLTYIIYLAITVGFMG